MRSQYTVCFLNCMHNGTGWFSRCSSLKMFLRPCPILKKLRRYYSLEFKIKSKDYWNYIQKIINKHFLNEINVQNFTSWKNLVLIYLPCSRKHVFYNTALSCYAPVRWGVNRVLESAGMSVQFVHLQVGITLYNRLTVNLIITKT